MQFRSTPSNFRHLARLFAISAALASNALAAGIKHGSLIVTQPVSTPNLTFGPDTTAGISLPDGSNRGDYWFDLGDTNPHVLISSVTENGRDSNFATSSAYPSSGTAQRYFISVHQAVLPVPSTSRVEDDINVALAFFSLDKFLGGFASNGNTNGAALTGLNASPGIQLGTQLIDNPDDTYTLDLTDPALDGSSDDGILLVNGAANREIYALSQANPLDETFTIYVHDNFENAAAYEQDQFSFVYIPTDHDSNQIVAMGRIDGAGQSIVSAGTFSVTNVATGTWDLSIPNETNTSGTLIISPEGGDTRNLDNILSYEWDNAGHWTIESRDLLGLGLQTPTDQPAFSFAFIKTINQIVHVDATATGNNDGSSWANAFTNLQDALAIAIECQTIHVAQGTYYPDQGNAQTDDHRSELFHVRSGIRILGGFPTGGAAADLRDPSSYPTILSGDIDQNDNSGGDNSENSRGIIFFDGSDATTLLDGFTITASNQTSLASKSSLTCLNGASPSILRCTFENNSGYYGGAVHADASFPRFTNCTFSENTAGNRGGAIYAINSSNATLTNCLFKNNFADGGGAVSGIDGFDAIFTNCAFQSNACEGFDGDGGAINIVRSSPSFINCSFHGNLAEEEGGAVYNSNDSAPVFQNCILWNNTENMNDTDTTGASIKNRSITSIPIFSHSLIANSGGSASWNSDLGIDSGNNIDIDPLFASATDLRILATSPALDIGLVSADSTTTDLAGESRIQNGTIDLGAFESQVLLFTPSDVLSLVNQGLEFAIADWAPDSSTINNGDGLNFQLTLTSSTGDLTFDSLPVIDPDGTLRFTLTASTLGSATFELVVSDPALPLSSSPARTFTISARPIYVDRSATGANDGSSWTDAYRHLQEAIAEAVLDLTPNQIWVAAGKHYPDEGIDLSRLDIDRDASFYLRNGVEIYGGFNGTETDFEERDPVANLTILSADQDQNDGSNFTGRFDNSYNVLYCRITDNTAILDGFTITGGYASGSGSRGAGGGLYCENGSPTLKNCIFLNNYAKANGGAISISSSSSPSLIDCSFQGNYCDYGKGGAIYTDDSSPTLTNCSFQNNSTKQVGQTTNDAGDGGAIYNINSSPTLSNCSFQNNSAEGTGGALFNRSSSPSLTNCSFLSNSARSGGAIYNTGSSPNLINCSFLSNSASFRGGAIYNTESSPSLTNCILWSNSSSVSNSNSNSNPTYSHCLIANSGGSSSWNSSYGIDNGNNIDVDPLFTSSTDPRLTDGSPALNIGKNSANTTPLDLDGNTRINTYVIDLGAYELQTPTILRVNANAPGVIEDGTSWETAFTEPQSALASTYQISQLWIAQGTYYPDEDSGQNNNNRQSTFTLKNEVEIYGGFNGTETDLEQRDPIANSTIFSGDLTQDDGPDFANNSENAYHVVTGSDTDATAVLDGVTITAGNADGPGQNLLGGGLFNNTGSPSLTNCTFQHNSSNEDGGAIYNLYSTASFTNCSIQNNTASNAGGAITNDHSSPTLTNCSLQNNSAVIGGAIYNRSFSSPTLTNCSFQSNSASHSGGVVRNFNDSSPTLTNCILWNNSVAGNIDTPSASVFNSPNGLPSNPSYSHCLIANSGGSTSWNSDLGTNNGNNLDADPHFTSPTDLRLLSSSPALNVGDNAANTTATDLAGNTRIQNGTIELGAFETSATTFAQLHPTLDPEADDNGNGMSNYGDYAAGNNPTATTLPPQIQLTGSQLIYTHRANAEDVESHVQKSSTLLAGSWSDLEPTDYSLDSETVSGGKIVTTLTLSFDPDTVDRMFFRQVFFVPE